MTTLGSLVDTLRQRLTGFGAQKPGVAALRDDLNASATTFQVDDLTGVSGAGVAEIGLETVRIKSVNPADNSVTLYPFGRGYRGTTAEAHAANSEVRFSDSWPARDAVQALNSAILNLYPTLYAVVEVTDLVPNSWGQVQIPTEATGIVSVWARAGSSDPWVEQTVWTFNPHDTPNLRTQVGVGQVRVIYSKRPNTFPEASSALAADFTTTTGLPPHYAELVLLGATASMAPYVDVSRLPYTSTAVREQGNDVQPPSAGQQAARYLYALYQQRLGEEAVALHREHPIKTNRTVM